MPGNTSSITQWTSAASRLVLPTAHVDPYVIERLPAAEHQPELHFDLVGEGSLAYPPQLNCAAELLDRMVASGHGERIALRTLDGCWTYRDLLWQSNRIACVLRDELGLLPGNRVLLRGYNNPMLAACWLGVLKAGGVVITSMPLLRARELRQMMSKAHVNFALCDVRLHAELQQALSELPEPSELPVLHYTAHDGALQETEETKETKTASQNLPAATLNHLLGQVPATQASGFCNAATRAEDPALIAFTSGTTGTPKASVHLHRDLLAICDTFSAHILRPTPADVFCGTSPLAFTYGLGGLLCFPLRHGASSLLLERPNAEQVLQAMRQHKVSICFSVPTFWRQLAALLEEQAGQAKELPHLRHCISAGEPLPDATRVAWRQASGKEIIDGLGSTELLHIFISHSNEAARRGAVGQAVPGYRICIMDENMQILPPNQQGRLAVQGPTGCRYLDDERQQDYVVQGWNLTGDTGHVDADGYFYFYARSDDMIVSAGYNIAGPEVEAALLQHPAVLECGVVGVADEERGQLVKAFVVLRAGWTQDQDLLRQLQEHCKHCIAPYKYPRQIEFISALPRTETSKLQRFRLRERAS